MDFTADDLGVKSLSLADVYNIGSVPQLEFMTSFINNLQLSWLAFNGAGPFDQLYPNRKTGQ
jgi:hypothetical protein